MQSLNVLFHLNLFYGHGYYLYCFIIIIVIIIIIIFIITSITFTIDKMFKEKDEYNWLWKSTWQNITLNKKKHPDLLSMKGKETLYPLLKY